MSGRQALGRLEANTLHASDGPPARRRLKAVDSDDDDDRIPSVTCTEASPDRAGVIDPRYTTPEPESDPDRLLAAARTPVDELRRSSSRDNASMRRRLDQITTPLKHRAAAGDNGGYLAAAIADASQSLAEKDRVIEELSAELRSRDRDLQMAAEIGQSLLFKKEESEREYLDHVAALQKEIAALEAKNKAYGTQMLSSFQDEMNELVTLNAEQKDAISSLRAEVDAARAERDLLKRENREYTQDLGALRKDHAKVASRLKDREGAVQRLQKSLDELSMSYDTVSAAAFEDVERKNASLKSEITSLTLSLEHAEAELERSAGGNAVALAAAEKRVGELEKELEETQVALEVSRGKCATLRDDIAMLEMDTPVSEVGFVQQSSFFMEGVEKKFKAADEALTACKAAYQRERGHADDLALCLVHAKDKIEASAVLIADLQNGLLLAAMQSEVERKLADDAVLAERTELTGLLIAEEARRAAVEDELENVVRVALQESQQAHTELCAVRAKLEADLDSERRLRREREDMLAEVRSQVEELRGHIGDVKNRLEGELAEKAAVIAERNGLVADKRDLTADKEALTHRLAETESRLSELVASNRNATDELNNFRERLDEERGKKRNLEDAKLVAEKAAIALNAKITAEERAKVAMETARTKLKAARAAHKLAVDGEAELAAMAKLNKAKIKLTQARSAYQAASQARATAEEIAQARHVAAEDLERHVAQTKTSADQALGSIAIVIDD